MNEEQVKSLIRSLVSSFGGMIAGFFAAKGWFTIDQVTSVLNSPTFVGLATSIAVGIWGLFVHKQSNAVAVYAAIAADPASPAKAAILENTVAGRALGTSILNANPEAIVAIAGTDAAARVARTSPTGETK